MSTLVLAVVVLVTSFLSFLALLDSLSAKLSRVLYGFWGERTTVGGSVGEVCGGPGAEGAAAGGKSRSGLGKGEVVEMGNVEGHKTVLRCFSSFNVGQELWPFGRRRGEEEVVSFSSLAWASAGSFPWVVQTG